MSFLFCCPVFIPCFRSSKRGDLSISMHQYKEEYKPFVSILCFKNGYPVIPVSTPVILGYLLCCDLYFCKYLGLLPEFLFYSISEPVLGVGITLL